MSRGAVEILRIPRGHPRGSTDLIVSLRTGQRGRHVMISSGPWSVHLGRGDLGEVIDALERARLLLATDEHPPKPAPEAA